MTDFFDKFFGKRKPQGKKTKHYFLDTILDDHAASMLKCAKQCEKNTGLKITFEGYQQVCDQFELDTPNPFIIVQTKEQISLLEKGIIEGIIHIAKNDYRGYITGTITEDYIQFVETNHITSIHAFLMDDNKITLNVSQYTHPTEKICPIYDAIKEGDLMKGHYYEALKVKSHGCIPSSIGNITIKCLI